MSIDYQQLKKLFPSSDWDVSLLTEEYYEECLNSPIKAVSHFYGYDLSVNPLLPGIKTQNKEVKTFLVLARKTEKSNDYSLYKESADILKRLEQNFVPVYLNFKKAAVLSGMGSVAKNSLVYNRKFGFQCKFCMYAFEDPDFINIDNIKVDRNQLELCNDCNDCIKNCPVGAIHETWIDAKKCDNHISFGNDKEASSIKWTWWENLGQYKQEYTKEQVEEWDSAENHNVIWDGEFNPREGIIYKNGIPIDLNHCRRCQEQPRCSKLPT